MAENEGLLHEIKEEFTLDTAEWEPCREERRRDILALSPVGTWSDYDRKDRESNMRPCLSLDELNQYVNQLINDARSSKRAIEVNPEGNGANDAQARYRADQIRQIEYRSNAQQAYTSMFEDTVQGSYGFLRVKTQYLRDTVDKEAPTAAAFDQGIGIEALPNPDLVTPDRHAILPDLSDMKRCHIRQAYSEASFKREFKHATQKSFDQAAVKEAGSAWADGNRIWVSEYWAVEYEPRNLVLLPGQGEHAEPLAFWKDTIPKADWAQIKGTVLREREVPSPYVCQRIMSGLEIIQKNDWKGKYIPIVACLGKVLWVDHGGAGPQRQIMSLIRLARDAQQLYNYYRTQQAEMASMIPKTPVVGYVGQFKGVANNWAKAPHEPVAFLEAHATTEATGSQILPLPQRLDYHAGEHLQALELAAEGARRAIQAAMGSGFLPTAAQRKNEKSGVALEKIESTAQKGSFHFIDHYDGAIQRTGLIINDLIPHTLDTARNVNVRKPDDTMIQVRINDKQSEPHKEYGEPIDTSVGEYDVTIATGPSYESEREKANEFADLIAQNPAVFPMIGDLVVKLKNLGPIGDEISKRLKQLLPPELREDEEDGEPDIAAMKKQLMQGQQLVEALMAKVKELEGELATDAIKAERDVTLAQIKGELEKVKIALQFNADLKLQDDKQAHEMSMAGAEAAHSDTQLQQQAEQQRKMGLQSAAVGGGAKKAL
jgi:hypothetical protein